MRQRRVTGFALTLSGAAAAAMLINAPSAFAATSGADAQVAGSVPAAQVVQAADWHDDDADWHDGEAAAWDDNDTYRDGYRDGYRTGYSDGLGDAKDDCDEDDNLKKKYAPRNDYERGIADGYNKGYPAGYQFGYDKFCQR